MLRSLAPLLALAFALAPFAAAVVSTPPPGLGASDAWLDANGDVLFGDLDAGLHAVRFNGVPLASPAPGTLAFGAAEVCVQGGPSCGGAGYAGAHPVVVSGSTVSLSTAGCAPGALWKWTGTVWGCQDDEDTTYGSGSGILLSGGLFSLMPCAPGFVPKSASVGSWMCSPDQDTTYAAGAGLALAGGVFSLAAPTATTPGGVLARACAVGEVVTGVDGTGKPVCAVEGRTRARSVPAPNVATVADGAGSQGKYVSATVGQDGLPVVAYQDGTGLDLKVLKCGTLACDSGNTLATVDAVGSVGLYTSVAIGHDGLPVVAYYDALLSDLKIAKCGNAACSAGNVITLADAPGSVGAHASLAVGLDGRPVVSYYDLGNGDLKVLKCGTPACDTGNAITTLDGLLDNVGQYTSVAIGLDGLPMIAYYDVTNQDLKLARCANVSCTSASSIQTLDAAGTTGLHASITVADDGLPVVAFYTATPGVLKVLKCADAACAAPPSIVVADGVPTVGQYASVTIGADGFPTVAHYDATNGDLRLLKCGSADCASGNVKTVVDAVGNVGQYTSITLGADGRPFIAYHDVGNLDLKVVRLANPTGVSGWARR